jgi:hypothetical protein
MVVPALVNLIKDSQSEGISLAACINAAKTLSGIATTDQVRFTGLLSDPAPLLQAASLDATHAGIHTHTQGVESCLKYKVPGTLVGLAQRALTGG